MGPRSSVLEDVLIEAKQQLLCRYGDQETVCMETGDRRAQPGNAQEGARRVKPDARLDGTVQYSTHARV